MAITSDNIFTELSKAGMTWKVYAESLPRAGYLDDGPYPYAKRHNPAVWYADVINSSEMLANVVPFTQFAQDMAAGTLPNYSLLIPNLVHDAHDGSMAQADAWLQENIGRLLTLPFFLSGGDGLVFVTFDECGNGTNSNCGGHVMTAVLGPNVIPHTVSNVPYQHQNLLRTVFDSFGLASYPGASATAQDMADFFPH